MECLQVEQIYLYQFISNKRDRTVTKLRIMVLSRQEFKKAATRR